ncbi:MAG: WG repeat-containing protein [Lewinellaceae bacterium]|nr:WG repeat-containing protein [Lewinellaceae bacterium]
MNCLQLSEGLAPVQLEKSGKWGYIDTNGKVAIDYQFAHAKCFFQGLAVVQSFMTKRGE